MILPGPRFGRIRLFAVVFLLLAAAGSLYSRGAKENAVLTHADELIDQKEFDEAVLVLSEYMKDNPDNFGEAQQRLQKIIRQRDRYNEVANELLDTLETDPGNDTKILELSDLLRSIESPNNPATRRFLDQVRYLAEFNVNRDRLERILVAAREQLENNNFTGALATYASGLDIYQATYFSSGYGQEAEDLARNGLLEIGDNIQTFNSLERSLSLAAMAITGLDGAGFPNAVELESEYIKLVPHLDQLIILLESFVDVQKSFASELTVLQSEYEGLGDRTFLSFAGWLLSGASGQMEGMIGTMEKFWRFRVGQVDLTLKGIIDRSYAAGNTAMNARDYAAGISAFNDTSSYIHTAIELNRNWNPFLKVSDPVVYSIYDETVHTGRVEDFLNYKNMDIALDYFRKAGAIGNRGISLEGGNDSMLSSWQAGILEASTAIAREQEIRRSYQELIDDLDGLENEIGTEMEESGAYLNNFSGIAKVSLTALNDAQNLTVNLRNRYQTQQNNSIIRQYTIANGDLGSRTDAREKEANDASKLIQGIPQTNEATGVYTAHYPAEGLAILTRMNQNLDTDIGAARKLISDYSAETVNVRSIAEMRTLNISTQVFLDRLLALQTRSAGYMATARTDVERAASLRYEGDRLFQAAQTALNQNNFDSARNNLTRATDQYYSSLSVQESSSLRELWDTQLVRLGADIVRIENEVVVRDVRNLLTTAQTQYFAGNIESAEDSLVRAQNRWRVTNITEQPEVEYWLTLVRGALSIQSGRTIPPTAPLYAEMSQLLSDANRNYNEGVRLLSGGQRQAGLAVFSEALDKTREVRLMFPLNFDARVLELRIEQQTDIPVFNASFRQRINEAVTGTKTRNAQSFADLQVLAQINPGYPGIQGILTQAEIDMGLRPPPPDPRNLARSTELSRNAQTVINARDNLSYEVAEAWLTDAIRLNPNNAQAQTLMDQLQILMRGTGTIVISSYAQDQYNVALQEFLRGNYLSANAIVMQLLQNPENQKSTQIQELKRRIDAVL